MWQVNNNTSYAAAATWTRDKDGAHHWNVAVKASFDILDDGNLRLADERELPRLLPEYRGDPTSSSLVHEAELAAMKPATDVLVNGFAIAPRGEPRREVPIALRFATVEKVLVARGINVYHDGPLGLSTTKPEPFERMPVVYEHAFGGRDRTDDVYEKQRFDTRNPVGVGFMAHSRSGEHPPGPNIVYPGRAPSKAGPAGFGPIASYWEPRCLLAGTYDATWVRDRRPLLPRDYDERFVLCAPADQRAAGYLEAGTQIEVVNMTPAGVLRFELPEVELRMVTRIGARREEYGAQLVTVSVDTERQRVSLVWQSDLLVPPRRVAQLDETRITER